MSAVMPLQAVPARPKPASTVTRSGLLLQRKCACGAPAAAPGHTCDSCAGKAALQAKYTIGAGNDPLEHEADRVADAVLAAAPVAATAGAQGGAAPRIQRFSAAPSAPAAAAAAPASVERVLASPGRALDAGLQRDMGQRFGHDFSGVRVHADAAAGHSAQEVNAHAYTVGRHIAFAPGRFAPATRDGRRLLAHELTHVVQQSGSAPGAGMPAVLRRAEVAGCRSDTLGYNEIGDKAHDVVQSWCAAQNPPCHREVAVPGGSRKGTGNTGYADMVVSDPTSSKVIEVGEIKPRSRVMDPNAYKQLLGYMEALQALHPDKVVRPMSWVPGPPNGMYPFLEPRQFLGCAPGGMGMYFYQCWRNKKRRNWRPHPIPIPKEVYDQIKDRLKKFSRDLDLGTDGGRRPLPAPSPAPALSPVPQQMPGWVLPLLVAALIVAAIVLIPWEAVLAIGAAALGALRVAAVLLGLTSVAWAGEGGGGGAEGQAGAAKGEGEGGAGAGSGAGSGSGAGGAGQGTSGQGKEGEGAEGSGGSGGSGGGGIAWDPLLDALKDPDGSKLSPQDVARIKAQLPAILARLRAAAADDPDAEEIVDMLEQLELATNGGGGQGGGGATAPAKPAPPAGAAPSPGATGEGRSGGDAAKAGARKDGEGAGARQDKRKPAAFGRFVAPVPAPADTVNKGSVTYSYDSGLESVLLKSWRPGARYEVVISVSIGDKPALSRLNFKVDRREGDQIVLTSTNTANLVIQPADSAGWLVIAPGSTLLYRPADAPKPQAPRKETD